MFLQKNSKIWLCISLPFLICRKNASATKTFMNTKVQIQTAANQGRERMQKQGRNSQVVGQPWGRVRVPTPEACITVSLSSNDKLLPLPHNTHTHTPKVEDGNFRLSPRFLEHHTSPPTSQKKVTHTAALTPNVAFLPPLSSKPHNEHPIRPPV